jgi:endonuclease/exonuclease/phosphatase family metal-dependent hydrolase
MSRKKKKQNKIIGFLVVLLIIYGFHVGLFNEPIDYTKDVVKEIQKNENLAEVPLECEDCISIANWNIQTFGKTKWGREYVREKIIEIVPNYDIIFIQEIRDKSGDVFEELCDELMPYYRCEISSRAGRTSSKEQYGLVYRRDIEIQEIIDYNLDEDANDYWERPPYRVDFIIENYTFTAYNIHIKPDDVDNELLYLESLVEKEKNEENVVLLGDFNADGFYYDEDDNQFFLNYEWVIDNSIDTTLGKTDNTYDRIIMNKDMYNEYYAKGVYTNITTNISDHYPVWAQIEI